MTEDRSEDFLERMGGSLGARPGDVVAFGHTHKPWHRVVSGVHFVNTGSVGRPKDGDPRAGYVVIDFGGGEMRVESRRLAYDVEQTAQAIVASELPNEFAEDVRTGGVASAARQ
ncbi:MAG: metallophosphoesterase family protein [Gemmatimonadaceae bacterium]